MGPAVMPKLFHLCGECHGGEGFFGEVELQREPDEQSSPQRSDDEGTRAGQSDLQGDRGFELQGENWSLGDRLAEGRRKFRESSARSGVGPHGSKTLPSRGRSGGVRALEPSEASQVRRSRAGLRWAVRAEPGTARPPGTMRAVATCGQRTPMASAFPAVDVGGISREDPLARAPWRCTASTASTLARAVLARVSALEVAEFRVLALHYCQLTLTGNSLRPPHGARARPR